MSHSPLVIAIDGPAASGKGTLARQLGEHLNLPHFDTGLTYRAVAYALLQANLPLDDEELAVKTAANLDLSKLDRNILSAHEIGTAASKIAVMSRVRQILVEAQRKFAMTPPGAIMDGRDIGTVVCPDATIKFYVTASPEIRAKRRYDEIIQNGKSADYEEIFADILKRDERDMGRKDSPLRPAEDAHLLDTSKMSIENAFQKAIDLIEQAVAD
ncbi:MAG: (d)CMP kinase [Rhizobiaceae bacterium]|nr:(d)CMP kinase [Rhizobiaceae bacterium]